MIWEKFVLYSMEMPCLVSTALPQGQAGTDTNFRQLGNWLSVPNGTYLSPIARCASWAANQYWSLNYVPFLSVPAAASTFSALLTVQFLECCEDLFAAQLALGSRHWDLGFGAWNLAAARRAALRPLRLCAELDNNPQAFAPIPQAFAPNPQAKAADSQAKPARFRRSCQTFKGLHER